MNRHFYILMIVGIHVATCLSMDTEKLQQITITNKSSRTVRVFGEIAFRQTALSTAQAPQQRSQSVPTSALSYLVQTFANQKPTSSWSTDGDTEEPKALVKPGETEIFTLFMSRTIPSIETFEFRKKAWINLYHPDDTSNSQQSRLASYQLDNKPSVACVITENAQQELTISPANQ